MVEVCAVDECGSSVAGTELLLDPMHYLIPLLVGALSQREEPITDVGKDRRSLLMMNWLLREEAASSESAASESSFLLIASRPCRPPSAILEKDAQYMLGLREIDASGRA